MIETIRCRGIICFDPIAREGEKTTSKPWWMIVKIEEDVGEYYRYQLKKRYRIHLVKPLWGTHISVIRGEGILPSVWKETKERYDEKIIIFKIELLPKSNGEHWWMKVHSRMLENIRENTMLTRRPYFNYHMTLGTPKLKNLEHSKYIYSLYKKNLLNL